MAEGTQIPDRETSLDLLGRMMLIRRFEEEAGSQYQRAKAGGVLHLAIGEEATIVGTAAAMRPGDYLVGTYRTHGHAIARGTPPSKVMAEIFGRVDGTSGGRGGSMHVFDAGNRFMGGQLFQPFIIVLVQAGFIIVDENRGAEVHGIDQGDVVLSKVFPFII